MDLKKKSLLAASVAGLMAAAGLAGGSVAFADEHGGSGVPCYGINKCKGVGDCGGKGRSCGGTNECAGKGFIKLDKDLCLKIKDGSLTPPAES